jgi:hypothetical protein
MEKLKKSSKNLFLAKETLARLAGGDTGLPGAEPLPGSTGMEGCTALTVTGTH